MWERPEPQLRPAPTPLSREAIVRAAVKLADEQGVAAVSLRNVGAALDAGPMRLYGYVATKEELLELMVDTVWGELTEPLSGHWRDVLSTLAQRVRDANQRHPWFVALLGGRPPFGPNALAHRETAFAALAANRGFENIDFVMEAYRALLFYVIGALQSEQNELRDAGELEEHAYQAKVWPYLQRMMTTGRYPVLARIITEANHPSPDEIFQRGLHIVLDGIATRVA